MVSSSKYDKRSHKDKRNLKKIAAACGSVLILLVLSLIVVTNSRAGEMLQLGGVEYEFEKDGDYYLIDNEAQLKALIKNGSNEKFRLSNDITITKVEEVSTGKFGGELDGNGHAVIFEEISIASENDIRTTGSEPHFIEGIMFAEVTGTIRNLFINIGSNSKYTFEDTQPMKEILESEDLRYDTNDGRFPTKEEFIIENNDLSVDKYVKSYENSNEGSYIENSDSLDSLPVGGKATYYYKKEVNADVYRFDEKYERSQKFIDFGMFGAVRGAALIENVHFDGNQITVGTIAGEYGYIRKYRNSGASKNLPNGEHVKIHKYYEVEVTSEKAFERRNNDQQLLRYMYAFLGGKFLPHIPLYQDNNVNGTNIYKVDNGTDGLAYYDLAYYRNGRSTGLTGKVPIRYNAEDPDDTRVLVGNCKSIDTVLPDYSDLNDVGRKDTVISKASHLLTGPIAGDFVSGTMTGVVQKIDIQALYSGTPISRDHQTNMHVGALVGRMGNPDRVPALIKDFYLAGNYDMISEPEQIDSTRLEETGASVVGSHSANGKIDTFVIDNGRRGQPVSSGNELAIENYGFVNHNSPYTGLFKVTDEIFKWDKMQNWKCIPAADFVENTTTERSVYTPKWLYRGNYKFEISQGIASDEITNQLTITLHADDEDKTEQEFSKANFRYKHRPSVKRGDESSGLRSYGKAINMNRTGLSELYSGNSGYFYISQLYATDGRYHYSSLYRPKSNLKEHEYSGEDTPENAKYFYPYINGGEYSVIEQDNFIRDEQSKDYIHISGDIYETGEEAKFHYIVNKNPLTPIVLSDWEPNPDSAKYRKAEVSNVGSVVSAEEGRWETQILFITEYVPAGTMQINGFWEIDDRIYPVIETQPFTTLNYAEMVTPTEFGIFRYYLDTDDSAQELLPYFMPVDINENTGAQAVSVGDRIRINEFNEAANGILYFTKFTDDPGLLEYIKANEGSENVIFDTGELNGVYNEKGGLPTLEVPDSNELKAADEFYLYIMKTRSTAEDDKVYARIPLRMVEGVSIRETKEDDVGIVSGEEISFDISGLGIDPRGITGVYYTVADMPLSITSLSQTISHADYQAGDKITLNKAAEKVNKYVYIQAYGMSTTDPEVRICSELMELKYTFLDSVDSPTINPVTIEYEAGGSGAIGATICAADEKVSLLATDGSVIVYLVSEDENAALTAVKVEEKSTLEKLAAVAEDTTELMGRLYVKSNGLWYLVSEGARLYQAADGITLLNASQTNKFIHVNAMAFLEGKENSNAVHYVYEVEPTPQTAPPTPEIYTTAEDPTQVKLKSALFFQSATPDAEMYYTLDGSMPEISETGATKKYDPQKGITVQGQYFGLMRVNILAIKKDADGNPVLKPSETASFVYRIEAQDSVDAPVSVPATKDEAPAIVEPGKKILLNSDTSGATIYYTTDGQDPEVTIDGDKITAVRGKRYNAANGIIMPENGTDFFTLRAIAVKPEMQSSPIVQMTFQYPAKVLPPYASPASGTYNPGLRVSLTNATEGATIYYEVAFGGANPKDPKISSAIYDDAQPFIINRKTIIKAIAIKDGVRSKVGRFTYDTNALSDLPAASIDNGSVVARSSVLNLSTKDGSAIYYTTDGSDPTDMSNTNVVAGDSLMLDGEYGSMITVKASGKGLDKAFSEINEFTYQISKYQGGVTSDIENGAEISQGATLNLMSDISNAKIYYTIDGTNPSAGSAQGTALTLNGSPGTIVTVKAMAIPEGLAVNAAGSATAIFNYKLKDAIMAPQASPAGGTLNAAISVTLTAAKGNIYYTTDGTVPTVNSSLYKAPISVNKSMQIRAIAATEEGEVSQAAVFTYTTAMRAVKPNSSLQDGILKPGTIVELSTATDGAQIYYSTDGTVPGMDNLNTLSIYDGAGIKIDRTVSIQAAAYKEGLLISNVAAFNYEVTEVPAEEERKQKEAEEAEKALKETDATALEGKRMNTAAGTTYKDIIIAEEDCNTIVAAQSQVIPETTKLVTTKTKCEKTVTQNIKALLGEQYNMLSLYNMKLYENSEMVQPDGSLEIGIPIPSGYEDASVRIVYVDADGKVKIYETRRDGGMAYAITDHFSLYGLVGVRKTEENGFSIDIVHIVAAFAIIILVAGLGFAIVQFTQKKLPKRVRKK